MKRTGFYIIKEKFFEDMSDLFLKGNKVENRPHYYFTPTQPNVIAILGN